MLSLPNSQEYLFVLHKSGLFKDKYWDIMQSEPHLECSFNWLMVQPRENHLPSQGWKLHISAIVADAEAILCACMPILAHARVAFKLPQSYLWLEQLNLHSDYSVQAGKFITIYSNSDAQSLKLAQALHLATSGFRGPRIITDNPYTEGSLVYYRWGAYTKHCAQTIYGEVVTTKRDEYSKIFVDRRLPYYSCPTTVINPFPHSSQQDINQKHLLKKQYVMVKLLSYTAHCETYLGFDLLNKRRCIIKKAYPYAGYDSHGRDARDKIRHEYKILSLLQHHAQVPGAYDLFETENRELVLVMSDIPGDNLNNLLLSRGNKGIFPTQQEIRDFAFQLAQQMTIIHAHRIVHTDLKLENIIIANNIIYVIDFDTAYILDSSKHRFGIGTPGFQSMQQKARCTPEFRDDIYSFGALLFYYAINSVPNRYGHIDCFSGEDYATLHPNISPWLARLLTNTLSPEANKRYPNFTTLISDLDLCTNQLIGEKTDVEPVIGVEQAVQLGDYLISQYYDATKPSLGFESKIDNHIFHDLRGTAAALISFAYLYTVTGQSKWKDFLLPLSHCLIEKRSDTVNPIAGLYVGLSGMLVTIAYISKLLSSQQLMENAIELYQQIKIIPHDSLDLFNGSAGRLRAILYVAEISEMNWLFSEAKSIVQIIIDRAIYDNDTCYWTIADVDGIPHQIQTECSVVQLGYAHGIAGIIDALLDYYQLFPEPSVKLVIQSALRYLKRHAVLNEDISGIAFPVSPNETVAAPYWCHGATGIGYTFLHAYENGIDPEGLLLAKLCGVSAAEHIPGSPPIQCHGLSGNIDFLLAIFNSCQEPHFLARARQLAIQLEPWINNINNFPFGAANLCAKSYMTGIPGIIMSCIKISGLTSNIKIPPI